MATKSKKAVAVLCILCMLTAILPTIGPVANVSAKTYQGGVLKWDFESSNDFAPLDRGISNYGYVKNHPDTIGSGAWSRQIVDAWPADGAPFQTTFDRIFTTNSEADSSVSPWVYVSPTESNSSLKSFPLTGGGSYCAVVNSSTGVPGRSVGMCIMLEDTEFIPGRRYKVSADLFSASSGRAVYVGLSRPSERTTAATKVNPVWLSDSSHRSMLATGTASNCADNKQWRKGEGYITPTVDMYENGKILFYIGGADLDASHTQLPKNECLYIDNLVIEPQDSNLTYSKITGGRIWDFEEGADKASFTTVLGAYDDAGKAIDGVNQWGPLARESLKTSTQAPRYIKVSEATARMYGRWDNNDLPASKWTSKGYAGSSAHGSNECIYVKSRAADGNWDGGVYSLGIRTVLSQEEFPAGTYKLGFWGASTRSCSSVSAPLSGDTWRVAVLPTERPGLWNTYPQGESDSLATATMKVDTGLRSGSFWSYYTVDVTLTDASFTNGTTSLIIYINTGSNNMYGGEALFFDDISLAPIGDFDVTEGGNYPLCAITTSSNSLADAAVYAAVYDDNKLVDIAIQKDIASTVARLNFNANILPEYTNPKVKMFVWDKDTMMPLGATAYLGEYEHTSTNASWVGQWTNISTTRGDEASSPTVTEDGKKKARITFKKLENIFTSVGAEVYDSEGTIFSSATGSDSLSVEVPCTDSYTVTLYAKNDVDYTKANIGEYTKAQFEDMLYYPALTVYDDGKYKTRLSFENGVPNVLSIPTTGSYEAIETYANSGDKALYISDRKSINDTFVYKDKINNGNLTVTAYLRNDDSVSDSQTVQYRLTIEIPGHSSVNQNLNIKGNSQWQKVSATVDLTPLNIPDGAEITFKITTRVTTPYYIDDFAVTTDTQGRLYDDLGAKQYALDAISVSPVMTSSNSSDLLIEQDIASLKDVYKDYFKLGACVKSGPGFNDTNYQGIIKKHFNSIVADGFFKRAWIQQDTSDLTKYNLGGADKLMQFAEDNGMEMVGHCLVWAISGEAPYNKDANGNWLSRDAALVRMKEYITKIMNHFNGKDDPSAYAAGVDYENWHVPVWDVVNEAALHNRPVDDLDVVPYQNRGSGYLNTIGTDYVKYAYRYARDVDPTAELRYNDFEDWYGKRNNICALVRDVNSEANYYHGKPLIDTVGFQAHFTPDITADYVRESVEAYIGLGTGLDITEFDMTACAFYENRYTAYADGLPKLREYEQARLVHNMFNVFKENSKNIGRVTFWTTNDQYSHFEGTEFAGIFDRNNKAKPQYWALVLNDADFAAKYPEFNTLFDKTSWTFSRYSDTSADVDLGAWTRMNSREYLAPYQPIFTTADNRECVVIKANSYDAPYTTGMRIKLSTAQLTPGKTYTLSFDHKMLDTKYESIAIGKDIYAALVKPSNAHFTNAEKENPALTKYKCGLTSNTWSSYSTDIKPTQADFENGYTILYLTVHSPLDKMSYSQVYFDDVHLVEKQ